MADFSQDCLLLKGFIQELFLIFRYFQHVSEVARIPLSLLSMHRELGNELNKRKKNSALKEKTVLKLVIFRKQNNYGL